MNMELARVTGDGADSCGVAQRTADQLVHLHCLVMSLTGGDSLRQFDSGGVMSDTGAKLCLMELEDNLVRCMDIAPVTVGLAMKTLAGDTPTPFTCWRMGFLPMLREDGVHHYQQFLVHPQASNTIMSPEAIMNSSSVFRRFTQMG